MHINQQWHHSARTVEQLLQQCSACCTFASAALLCLHIATGTPSLCTAHRLKFLKKRMSLEALAGQNIRFPKCRAWATAQVIELAAAAAAVDTPYIECIYLHCMTAATSTALRYAARAKSLHVNSSRSMVLCCWLQIVSPLASLCQKPELLSAQQLPYADSVDCS